MSQIWNLQKARAVKEYIIIIKDGDCLSFCTEFVFFFLNVAKVPYSHLVTEQLIGKDKNPAVIRKCLSPHPAEKFKKIVALLFYLTKTASSM